MPIDIGPYSSSTTNFRWGQAIENVSLVLPSVTAPTSGGGPTIGGLGRLGDVPQPVQDAVGGKLSSNSFMVVSLLGSALGGALIGFVASQDRRGAFTGAALTAGLAALSDSVLAFREDKPVASAMFGAGGLIALTGVFLRFRQGIGRHGLSGPPDMTKHYRAQMKKQQYRVSWPGYKGGSRHEEAVSTHHMATSVDDAVEQSEFYIGYKPDKKPRVYVETGHGESREWRRLQGAGKSRKGKWGSHHPRRGGRIARITNAYVRTYSDSGQRTAYVEWIDERGERGRTEGPPDNPHMVALLKRARREGKPAKQQTWGVR
jgi:hypothetical protein